MMRKALVIGLIAILVVALGCERNIPSDIGEMPEAPTAPTNLSIAVGDGELVLSWTVEAAGSISKYFIYRSDQGPDTLDLYDSTTNQNYTDTRVLNGIRYYYEISSLSTSGIEGYRSPFITGIPGVYSIVIDNEAEYTNGRAVSVNPTAPDGTSHIMLSNSEDFSLSKWQNYSNSVGWELGDGDGQKTVYALFKDNEGNQTSDFYSDDIILDTKAEIDSFYIATGESNFAPGETIHFVLVAGEIEGAAEVSISDVGSFDLYDNGSNGDPTAYDGSYEFDYVIPLTVEVVDVSVAGNFTDRAGNSAAAVSLPYLLTINKAPQAPVLSAVGAEEDQIELSWVVKSIPDFSKYRLYRDDNAGVTEASELITTISSQNTVTYTDIDLEPSRTYYYRLFIYDQSGLSAGSNVVDKRTASNRAPDPVSLAIEVRSSDLRLTWTKNNDTDFESYRIYRSTSSISATDPNDDDLVVIDNSQSSTNFSDAGAETGVTYNYRVFVFDRFGLSAGSNQVSGQLPGAK
jgi:fibronectin type 3 domain-containing protein